jgi:hypothetical protein
MKTAMKALTFAALAGLSLGLSACGSSNATPTSTATPDAAEVTAASIDAGTPAAANQAPAAVASEAGKAAK